MSAVDSLLDSRKTFFSLLAGYFLLQLLIRLLLPDSLDLDEAEQIYQAQWWLLGYGPQPPLYNWLQQIFLSIFGHQVLALSLLKNLLLFGTWSLVYLIGLRVLQSHRLAVLGALSLVLLPQISWESQRDLTHSVLVTSLAAATLLQGLRTLERPLLFNYLVLGLVIGLGCNAKYSYLLFLAAVALSVLVTREARQVLLRPGLTAAALVALALCAPHWWWLLGNLGLASDATLDKLIRPTTEAFFAVRLGGLLSLLNASLQFLALFFLVFGLCFARRGRFELSVNSLGERLLYRYLLALGLLFVLFILVTGVNFVKDRWMQPLLLLVPVAALSLLRRESVAGQRAYARTALVFLALIPLLLVLRVVAMDITGHAERLNLPYNRLVDQAFVSREIEPDLVITDRVRSAGNIRYQLPETPVLTAERPDLGDWTLAEGESVWILWDASEGREIPRELSAALSNLSARWTTGPVQYLEIPYHYSQESSATFALARLQSGAL